MHSLKNIMLFNTDEDFKSLHFNKEAETTCNKLGLTIRIYSVKVLM